MEKIITLFILGISSVSDGKTHEVPFVFSFAGFAGVFAFYIWKILQGEMTIQDLGGYAAWALFVFLFMLLSMKFGNLGGADALLFALVGLTVGIYSLCVILFSFVLCIPYTFYMKIKKDEHEYAFVPYMFFSYLSVILYMRISFYIQ